MKKNKPQQEELQNKIDFSEVGASLNFAFCPTFPLRANNKTKRESGLFNSTISKDEIADAMLDIQRHFYICYSFKFDNNDKDYFFFQSFSALGSDFFDSEPLFGFFKEEEILMLISQIDEIFLPSKHEKQIYDTYINEVSSSADYLLSVMAEWTKLKLQDFEYSYLTSEIISKEIQELTERIKKTQIHTPAKRKARSKTKSKTNKNGTEPTKSKPKRSTAKGSAKPTKSTKSSKSSKSNDSSNGRVSAAKKTNTAKGRGVNSRSNKK